MSILSDAQAPPVATTPTAGRLLKLRPTVHASPVADGIHVRGPRSSFSATGGPGVWQVWRVLAARLADGIPAGHEVTPAGNPGVRAATATLLHHLREHDMLVAVDARWDEGPQGYGPPPRIARWLEAAAEDPAAAWARLRELTVRVSGTGPVAAASVRALRAAGVAVTTGPGAPSRAGSAGRTPSAEPGLAVLTGGGVTVAAVAGADVGYVSPPGFPQPPDGAAGAPTTVLAALVGAAAAHRVVCAVAGLPDPARDPYAHNAAPPARAATGGFPRVLVARLDPLRAAYHPWPRAMDHAAPGAHRPALGEALARAEAVCDPELGLLPEAEYAELPQIPAALARIRVGGTTCYGIGTEVDSARLGAALCAARLTHRAAPGESVVIGADRTHAEGMLLRRLVHEQAMAGAATPSTPAAAQTPDSDPSWARDAHARRWWKAASLRFAIPGPLRVRELAPGLYHAVLSPADGPPAWAVEATAGDAAAFCALNAAAMRQWAEAGGEPGAIAFPLCAAAPHPEPVDATQAPWQTGMWTWPAQTAAGEPALQRAARAFLPGPGPAIGGTSHPLGWAAVDSAAVTP